MPAESSPNPDKHEKRVQAVLALLRGDCAAAVSTRYGIGRSDLYKFRHRALTAIIEALTDRHRGPHRSHNHVADENETQVVALCQRHPTWSSYAVHRRCGVGAPRPRTY